MVRRQNTEIQFYLPRDFSLGLLDIVRTGLQETDPIWAIVIRPKDFEQFPFKTKVCNCHVRHLFRYLGPQKKCEFPTSIVVLWKRVYSIWETCSFWRKISRKRVGKEESIIETFKKKIRNTVFTQPPSVVNIRDRSFFFSSLRWLTRSMKTLPEIKVRHVRHLLLYSERGILSPNITLFNNSTIPTPYSMAYHMLGPYFASCVVFFRTTRLNRSREYYASH